MATLSGSDRAKMFSVIGLIRSGAGRSGWEPIGAFYAMYAQAGTARAGAVRSNYHSPCLFVSVNGVQRATGRIDLPAKILDGSLSISEVQGQTPNTCSFTAKGWTPTVGLPIVITLGSINNLDRLYAGQILSTDQTYVGTPGNAAYHANCIDWTWGLNKQHVTTRYTNTSATTIAQALIASYAPGYTSVNVQAGLATVDQITFTNQDLSACLTQLAKRIGADWHVDYHQDLHFFTADASETNPTILNAAHPTLDSLGVTRDGGAWVNRVYFDGGGANAQGPVAVGETILPVETAVWYEATGGVVRCGPQSLTYTGRSLGGGGALVGPGIGPSTALSAALADGAGIETGDHVYAVTYVTAAGESLPGPLLTVTVGVVAAPLTAPIVAAPVAGPGPDAGLHTYGVTFVTAIGETTASPLSTSVTTTILATPTVLMNATYTNAGGGPYPFVTGELERDWAYTWGTPTGETLPSPLEAPFSGPGVGGGGPFKGIMTVPVGPLGTTSRKIYRTVAGGSQLKLVRTIADNVTTAADDTVADGDLGANVPTTNTATANQVALAAIPVGAAAVTSRRIYRTVAAGSQLKLQATIADNLTTTATDATADAGLGATVPVTDTSGLAQPAGQILAGATSLSLADARAFPATGGWAVIGNGQQIIRYTGTTGNSLTGIPASGAGAIVATIAYNSTVTASPQITGIPASGAGSIRYGILKGDPVNLRVQVDDVAGQLALKALFDHDGTFDGICDATFQDGTLGHTEALARARAQLTLLNQLTVSVRWTCRDTNTHAGRTMTANIVTPTALQGAFRVQAVTISGFAPAILPTYQASASALRFSFDDLLRLLHGQVAA